MKIRLAIVDQDENYVHRLVNNLQINYSDKIEPYYFTSLKNFQDFLLHNMIHVVLVNEGIKVEDNMFSDKISFAYLVSSLDIEELNGRPAVCKFQKADLLYKNVLSLFADMEGKMVLKGVNTGNKCIMFTSAQGGAGTSSVAAAFAMVKAKQGQKVLYLNFDKFHKSEICFSGDGNMSLTDVIYAVKSKRGNLSIKLESAIKKDSSGVEFYDSGKKASDFMELNGDDVELLMKTLGSNGSYQYIIVDAPMDFSPVCKCLMEHFASQIIILTDGSEVGNIKFLRAMEMLKLMEQKKGDIYARCRLLYNRFSSVTSCKIMDMPLDTIGGINRIEGVAYKQLVDKLSQHPAMSQIL